MQQQTYGMDLIGSCKPEPENMEDMGQIVKDRLPDRSTPKSRPPNLKFRSFQNLCRSNRPSVGCMLPLFLYHFRIA